MIEPGAVLQVPALGVKVEIRETAESTGGEFAEFDVIGRARGIIAQPHVHLVQSERHEVIEGELRLRIEGREHVLGPGEAMVVPPGARHTQRPGKGGGEGRVRVQLRPAGDAIEFLERLAELGAHDQYNRLGLPRPVAAAHLVEDFGGVGHAAHPPLPMQRALARTILRATQREYVFVDEWDVAAPPHAVFDALADARTYPDWWKPVYIDVEGEDGPPAVGRRSRQHFKGRLPYHLRTESVITRCEPPHLLQAEVEGDLRGRGTWTLTERFDGGTHVRFDWRVFADRRLLRVLTPILRPALRANHAWAIARARAGLEPYAAALAQRRTVAPPGRSTATG
ncbi:MAG: hypothetical protein QOE28_2505 [Solirubrobacteraceae bacterium]|nr:hypothetical protein [Solirubrobacteraceae bacterium]